MNKETISEFIVTCITLTGVLFGLKVFNDEIDFNLLNTLPYLISSIVGGLLAVLYCQLFGWKLTKFPAVFSIVPAILLLVLIMFIGLDDMWLVDGLVFFISFMLISLHHLERKSKSL